MMLVSEANVRISPYTDLVDIRKSIIDSLPLIVQETLTTDPFGRMPFRIQSRRANMVLVLE